MGFREKYKKATKLNFSSNMHIHHIDRNRSNNDLSNLVHVVSLSHLRYHKYMNHVNDIIWFIDNNNINLNDLVEDKYMMDLCMVQSYNDKWINRLLSIEKYMKNQVLIRNKRLNINTENIFITEYQRKILEIFNVK